MTTAAQIQDWVAKLEQELDELRTKLEIARSDRDEWQTIADRRLDTIRDMRSASRESVPVEADPEERLRKVQDHRDQLIADLHLKNTEIRNLRDENAELKRKFAAEQRAFDAQEAFCVAATTKLREAESKIKTLNTVIEEQNKTFAKGKPEMGYTFAEVHGTNGLWDKLTQASERIAELQRDLQLAQKHDEETTQALITAQNGNRRLQRELNDSVPGTHKLLAKWRDAETRRASQASQLGEWGTYAMATTVSVVLSNILRGEEPKSS